MIKKVANIVNYLVSSTQGCRSKTGIRNFFLVAGCWLLIFLAASGQTPTTTALTSSENPQCQGVSITFTATITPDVGSNGTIQFLDGVTSLATFNVASSAATLSISTLSTGTHIITAVYSGGGTFDASTSNAISQVINSNPTIIASPASWTICSGATFGPINFSGAGLNGSYNWTRDNTTNLVGVDPAGPGGTTEVDGFLVNMTTTQQTTTFYIVGIDVNGCVGSTQATVTVNPAPSIADISGSTFNVCQNSTINLTDATSGGVWSTSDNNIAAISSSGVLTGVGPGTVIVTYTVTSSQGCVNSVSQSVTVNQAPTSSVTGSTTICAGSSTNITGTASVTPPTQVSVTNNENTQNTGFRQGYPLVYLEKSINITTLPGYTLGNGGNPITITVTVNILHQRDHEVELYLLPPGTTEGNGIANCHSQNPYNTPTQCIGFGACNGATHACSTPPFVTPYAAILLIANEGGNTANFKNTVFSDAAGQPISAGTGPFTGTYRPEIPFSGLDPNTPLNGTWTLRMVDHINSGYTGVYQNWTISFSIPGSAGGGTATWSSSPNDPNFTGGSYTGSPIAVSPTQTTTYTLTAIGANSCTAVSSATITVNPAISANAGPDQLNCNNGSFTLAGNSPGTGTGTWTVVSGSATIANPSSPTSGVTGVPAGTSATLRWSITSACGSTSDDVILTNGTPPIATGVTICQGGSGSISSATTCPQGTPTTSANRFAGSGASSGSGASWNNTGRITADDNSYSATNNISANGGVSQSLNATNFGFAASIPSNATIVGVQVTIGRLASAGSAVQDNSVKLIVGGTATGNNEALVGSWTTSEVAANYGATTDLWGVSGGLSYAQVTATNFGVALIVTNTSGSNKTASVDYVQMAITYTVPGIINWYTVSSGGTSIGTGSPFNPVGVSGSGLPNTNTPGTYPFYAECSSSPGCRSTVANFVIDPSSPASVTIIANPSGAICTGTSVTFTATPVNGGTTPSYQWKVNGANVGTNSTTYTSSTLNNGDAVTVVMTSNASCVSGSPATSNTITMTVTTGVAASVSIAASPTGAICQGASVAFTATPTNGGTTHSYQWKVNGTNAGTNSATFTSTTLNNGDVVTVVMTSNAPCVSGSPATSNAITMTVNPIPSTPVPTSNSPVCSGSGNTLRLYANVTGAPYSWTGPNGFTSTSQNPTIGAPPTTYSGTYNVTYTLNGCTSAPGSTNVIITSSLPASVSIVASPTGAICAGTSVTFTATPTNGGTTPTYQWQVNGTNVGTNSNTYTSSSLNNGDVVTVQMTSSLSCATPKPAISNAITMSVNPSVPASVSIAASPSGGICTGTSVTFTATPANGGTTPSYQWQVNGSNVGSNSNTYTSSTLNNSDVVTVIMTSNASCVTGSPAISNAITMAVSTAVPASVTIAASPAGAICSGTSVTFTATPTNGGTTPSYQWKVNSTNVGTNSSTFTSTTLANNDVVTVVMTSNATCVTGNPATSNSITMAVNFSVAASVSIAASPTGAICSGTSVTFTATPTNGGTTPSYQWKVNGTNVGTNSTTYTSSTLNNGDLVTVVMTSNATCVTGNPATSTTVTMTVNPLPGTSVIYHE